MLPSPGHFLRDIDSRKSARIKIVFCLACGESAIVGLIDGRDVLSVAGDDHHTRNASLKPI